MHQPLGRDYHDRAQSRGTEDKQVSGAECSHAAREHQADGKVPARADPRRGIARRVHLQHDHPAAGQVRPQAVGQARGASQPHARRRRRPEERDHLLQPQGRGVGALQVARQLPSQ